MVTRVERGVLLNMYRKMLEIRIFEEELYYLFLTGLMPGTMHQYIGQEAAAAGVCETLEKGDYITSTHRGHGHCLAKGVPMKEMMAELHGKKTGCCRGMGGSMHLVDLSVGLLGATGVVGAGIPIAVGAGLSVMLRGTRQVVACFFGEGATSQGAFHEALNLASVWNLPVVFVCENNLYAVSTHVTKTAKVKNIADRASAYGIEGVVVDGNDVMAVYHASQQAVAKARDGGGPAFIECKTYRHKGHSRFEPGLYRPQEELKQWMTKDPISRFKEKLIEDGIAPETELADTEKEIRGKVAEAIRFAKESPDVTPEDTLTYVYA